MAIYLHPNRAKFTQRRTALRLPQVRNESAEPVSGSPRPLIEQARKDIEAGQQDTDLRGMPGLENRKSGPASKRLAFASRLFAKLRVEPRRHAARQGDQCDAQFTCGSSE